jgi:hypothetical protein
MSTVKIPYGNFGVQIKDAELIDRYNGHLLVIVDGCYFVINDMTRLTLLRNNLNKHLPDVALDNWKMWVDWVNTLDPNTNNFLEGKHHLEKHAPNGSISKLAPFSEKKL